MIKGALFDIDDTLLSHELERVPAQTMKALDKLRAKGIKIGVCTSRIAAELHDLPAELLERIDCQITGTGSVTFVENSYLKAYPLDMEDAKKYTDYFRDHNISYYYTDINGDVYYWGDLAKVNDGIWLSYAKGSVKFKPYEDEEISNLFYYYAKDDEVEDIANINPGALISRWGNAGNICAPLIDKSFGLLKFCQVFSFTTDEIVAAGDGGNDDVMLEMAGIGIAVDDAKENTKAKADYICRKSIEDGGLYDALIETGVIEEDEYDIRMFVFDNDSTLFDHTIHQVRESHLTALKKLKEQGYILVLNTSRSPQEMYNVPAELLELMDVQILLDGAWIIYPDHVDRSFLAEDDKNRIISFLEEKDICYRYVTENGESYLNRHFAPGEKLFHDLYGMIPEVRAYDDQKVVHILYYATGEEREKIIKLAQKEENCRLQLSGEISPAGSSKGLGMLKVAEAYGIAPENICAFGDSGNDITMLQEAGLGIAVGNGSRSCKDAADYICEDISDEGIIKALYHFGFIEED